MEYDFYKFSPSEFERLVQSLYQNILGDESIVFGLGPDGGRELTCRYHDQYTVVQAKYKMRDSKTGDKYAWVEKSFKGEMAKFIEQPHIKKPEHYIFVTNCILSAVETIGGRDKIEYLKQRYLYMIPKITIISYDELCALITNNYDVRIAFQHHLFQPGDLLEKFGCKLGKDANSLILFEKEIRVKNQHLRQIYLGKNPILAIDFGTSYSTVAVMKPNGFMDFVPNYAGDILIPSTVTFFREGKFIVGHSPFKYVKTNSLVTVSNVKRSLGSKQQYNIFQQLYSPEQIATLIIKSLKLNAEEIYGTEFFNVLVSKPANFNLLQTKCLREAFEEAGLKVVRIIDEGTAASSTFAKHSEYIAGEELNTIVAIDLGGGTFDISVLEIQDNVYDTKRVFGDNNLGGYDFDEAILAYVKNYMNQQFPMILIEDYSAYLYEAERVKKVLSKAETATFIIQDLQNQNGNLIDLKIEITRTLFSKITENQNRKIKDYLKNIFFKSGSDSKISKIILSGQGSKIFTVREAVESVFQGIEIIDEFCENAVTIGNAEHAGILQGFCNQILVLNVFNSAITVATSTKEGRLSGFKEISVDSVENGYRENLFKPTSTLPVYSNETFVVQHKTAKQKCRIHLFETSISDNVEYDLIHVDIPLHIGANHIKIITDINVNSQIKIKVCNEALEFSKIINLN